MHGLRGKFTFILISPPIEWDHRRLTHNTLRIERSRSVDVPRCRVPVNVLLPEYQAVQIARGSADTAPELPVIMNTPRTQVPPVDIREINFHFSLAGPLQNVY